MYDVCSHMNVKSVIAGEYGGGGHRNASGFSVTLETWLEMFL